MGGAFFLLFDKVTGLSLLWTAFGIKKKKKSCVLSVELHSIMALLV